MIRVLNRGDWDQEIASLREKLREVSRLADADRSARIDRAVADYAYFCETYFPHLTADRSNLFHHWLDAEAPRWGRGDRVMIAAPRGNAKTTKVTRLYVLWRILQNTIRNVMIISDTIDQAKRSLEAISAELEENPRLADDFPGACGRGRIWQAEVIVTKNNIMVGCAGAGKRIRGINFRGARPDLIVLDDLENDENVRTPEQRSKLEHWFSHTVMHLGPPDGSAQLLYVGTWLHYDGLMARIIKRGDFRYHKFRALIQYPRRMDLWERWENLWRINRSEAATWYESHREEMDDGAQVLWPGVQPLVVLMEARASDRRAFNAELQNEPLDEATRIFRPDQFAYWEQLPAKLVCYGGMDPALGRSRGDYTAMVVVGRDPTDGKVYVVDAVIERIVPQSAIRRMIELQRRWQCVRWAVEEVAFQEFFRAVLVQEGLRAGVPIPAMGVRPRAPKDIRIESLAPYVYQGTIQFCRAHQILLDQLGYYPMADHDDGPDALEMAWSMAYAGHERIERRPVRMGGARGY